jgi:hypothetical protein
VGPFGVYRLGEGLLTVSPAGPEGQRVIEQIKRDGLRALEAVVRAVRDEFFGTGPGAELLERKRLLAAAEADLATVRAERVNLQERWKASVLTDGEKEVKQIERMIEDNETKAARLEAKAVAYADDVRRWRLELAPQLRAAIVAAVRRYTADGRDELEIQTERLTARVNELIPEWFAALYRSEVGTLQAQMIGQFGATD